MFDKKLRSKMNTGKEFTRIAAFIVEFVPFIVETR